MNALTPKKVSVAKKPVKPRKKRIPLELGETSKIFDSINLGVINEEKQYSHKVTTPTFVTGYYVAGLDNLRRTIIAHYTNQVDAMLWVADYSREMKDLGTPSKFVTEIQSTGESIQEMLTKIVNTEASYSEKVLYVTDVFQLVNENPELAAVILELLGKAKTQPDFHVFLQSHAGRLLRGDTSFQGKVFAAVESQIIAGNMLPNEESAIFGKRKLLTLGKDGFGAYSKGSASPVFAIRKTPPVWFKEVHSTEK